MTEQPPVQTEDSIKRNADFFNNNTRYEQLQERLEIYQLIRLSVQREVDTAQRLLDIGNGGFFNYEIDHISQVVACDLMLENEQKAPNVLFKNGSILDLPFEVNSFDTVLVQNVLHHVTGRSVRQNIDNMNRAIKECIRVLEPKGKLIIVESTVPNWFFRFIEWPAYTLLSPIWPFKHPLTFQFTRQHIANSIIDYKDKLTLSEQVIIPRGNLVIQFGLIVPTMFTPIQAVKFVAIKA